MNLELIGMEELNEQELMMVDGGRKKWWKSTNVIAAVVFATVAICCPNAIWTVKSGAAVL